MPGHDDQPRESLRSPAGQPLGSQSHGTPGSLSLALVFAGCVAFVSGLTFRGAWLLTLSTDLLPCLLTVVLAVLATQSVGEIGRSNAAALSGGAALAGVLLGRVLAWDLLGVVGRFSRQAAAATDWSARLRHGWEGLTTTQQWVDVLLWCLTPLGTTLLTVVLHSWCRATDSHSLQVASAQHLSPPAGAARTSRWVIGAILGLWIPAVACLHASLSRHEPSVFLRLTLPVIRANQMNTLLGYAHLRNGAAQMAEELPAIEQVTWFEGAVRSDSNFRFLRAGHAFLASLAAPIWGPEGSLRFLNVCAWLVGLACCGRMAARVCESTLAGWLAAALAAAGTGFAIHWSATTPHLLSFVLYALGLLQLIELQIGSMRRGWPIHRTIGLTIGLISLVYNVAWMLLLVYLAVGVRRQRWMHLAASGCVALTFPPLWRLLLPTLGINVLDVEGGLLEQALRAWSGGWKAGPIVGLSMSAKLATEAVTSLETPWILILGLIGLMAGGVTRDRGVVLWGIAAPWLACTLFAPAAGARGYIMYGTSVLWFAAAGGWLARTCRSGGWRPVAATAVLVAALAGQLAWSAAIARGSMPLMIGYFLGWDDAACLWGQEPVRIVNLTGARELPAVWPQARSRPQLALAPTPAPARPERRSRVLAFLSRIVFVFGLSLLLSGSIGDRRRQFVVWSWLLLSAVAAEAGFRSQAPLPVYREISGALTLAAGESTALQLQVSGQAVRELWELLSPERQLKLFLPAHESCRVEWTIDGEVIPIDSFEDNEAECDASQRQRLLRTASEWRITLTNPGTEPISIGGWHPVGAPGRSGTLTESDCLPGVEFRIRDRRTGRLVALGF